MNQPVTIESMLRELARDSYGETAKRLIRKLPERFRRLNIMQCLVLHRVASGNNPTESEYLVARNYLVRSGYLYAVDGTERGRNGKIVRHYRFTDHGELAHAHILLEFLPVVERVNNQRQPQEVTA